MKNLVVQWTLAWQTTWKYSRFSWYFYEPKIREVGNLSLAGQNSPAGVYENKKICTCESEGIS